MKKWLAIVIILFMVGGNRVEAANNTADVNWVEGPQKVKMGNNLSTLDLGDNFLFLNDKDTKIFQKELGNPPTHTEIGSIYPKEEDWFVVFEYYESGHIKDNEKNKIDAKALLKSYKDGEESSNKDRPAGEKLFVVGWDEAPVYDQSINSLTWALRLEDEKKEQTVNYNIKLLTRLGYVSVVLVTDPAKLQEDKKKVQELVLKQFKLNDGQRYSDYDPSKDKTSNLGLTGLILGGAGLVVAKKTGLIALGIIFFKKGWILIVAAGSFIWRKMSKLKANRQRNPYMTMQESSEEQEKPLP